MQQNQANGHVTIIILFLVMYVLTQANKVVHRIFLKKDILKIATFPTFLEADPPSRSTFILHAFLFPSKPKCHHFLFNTILLLYFFFTLLSNLLYFNTILFIIIQICRRCTGSLILVDLLFNVLQYVPQIYSLYLSNGELWSISRLQNRFTCFPLLSSILN